MSEISPEIKQEKAYKLIDRGECFQLIAEHPNGQWKMSIIPGERQENQKTVDTIRILFDGLDENEKYIDSKDIPGMDALDPRFLEELGDRYASRFISLGKVRDSDEAFRQVFLDISEFRETRRNAERNEWLKSWRSLHPEA